MGRSTRPARGTQLPRVTVELVLNQLRRLNFAVLATADVAGRPHTAGVNYGVAGPGHELAIYVMTRMHLQKARDIAQNPNVSLVVPVMRRVLWFLPPPTIQIRGHADILDWTDADGRAVFRSFWMGRRILAGYQVAHDRGETRICFLRITPEPTIATYLVGSHVWELISHMEAGAGKVVIPSGQASSAAHGAQLGGGWEQHDTNAQ